MPACPLTCALERAFAAGADRPAIVLERRDGSRATSYRELEAMVARLRRQLRELGVGAGHVVPLFADRTPESIALALAAVFEGAAFSWLNTRLRPPQLRQSMDRLGAVGLVVDPANAAAFDHASPEDEAACRPILLTAGGDQAPVAGSWPRIAIDGASDLQRRAGEARAPGAACVLFTSGSTGEPKGVLISAEDLARRAQTEAECFELRADDRLLGVLPLSFDVGLNQLFSALSSGAALHVSNAWMRQDLLPVVQEARITGIAGVPAIWGSATNGLDDGEKIFGETPALRFVTISGGSLPVAAFEQLTRRFDPHVAIHKTYGQSESFRSTIFLRANAPEQRARWGSVGRAVPGTRILIATDRSTDAAAGELGEIVHSGDGVMLGYLGDDQLTATKLGRHASTAASPVIYTGDYGYLDADGYLFLAGRADSMMKISGYRIYPREVEEVLAQFPGVSEVVVFGVDDPHTEKKVVAVIVGDVQVSRLRAFCAARLPAYMVPRRIVSWPELPRTSNGKPALEEIRRRFLEPAPP